MHGGWRWTVVLLAGWGMFCAYPYTGSAPLFMVSSRRVPPRSGGGITLMVRSPLNPGRLSLKEMRYAYPVSRGWTEGRLLLYSIRGDTGDFDALQATVARAWWVPLQGSPHRRYAFLRMGALLELYRGGVSAFALRPPLMPALELGLLVAVHPQHWMHVQLLPPAWTWSYVPTDKRLALTGGVEGYCARTLGSAWDAPLCPSVRWRVVAGLSFLFPDVSEPTRLEGVP